MSLDARITEAQRAPKESGPSVLRISVNVAIEALPERGLVKINVKISEGTPKRSSNGRSTPAISSDAPDAESMLTPTIKAHIVGRSEKLDFTPSLAPSKNEEK